MADETKCWLCGSEQREVRNLVFTSGPFDPDKTFEVNPDNTRQIPCNNNEYHDARIAA